MILRTLRVRRQGTYFPSRSAADSSYPSPYQVTGVVLCTLRVRRQGTYFPSRSAADSSYPSPYQVTGMVLRTLRVRRQGTYFPSRSAADPPLSESRVWLSGRSTLDVVLLTWCSLSDPPCCFLPSCDFGWATCRIRSLIQ